MRCTLLCERNDVHSRHAAVLIAACAGYGLRRLEAFGLSSQHFDATQPLHLSLTRSGISDLKTHRSRRVIATALAVDTVQDTLNCTEPRERFASTAPIFVRIRFKRFPHHLGVKCRIWQPWRFGLQPGTPQSFCTIYAIHLQLCWALPSWPLQRITDRDLHHVVSRLLGSQHLEVTHEILQSPSEWPFAIEALHDRINNATVSTFLDTYFHACI